MNLSLEGVIWSKHIWTYRTFVCSLSLLSTTTTICSRQALHQQSQSLTLALNFGIRPRISRVEVNQLWDSAEKFIDWPRCSHRIWPSVLFFNTGSISPLFPSVLQCLDPIFEEAFILARKVINSIHWTSLSSWHWFPAKSIFKLENMIIRWGQMRRELLINQFTATLTFNCHWNQRLIYWNTVVMKQCYFVWFSCLNDIDRLPLLTQKVDIIYTINRVAYLKIVDKHCFTSPKTEVIIFSAAENTLTFFGTSKMFFYCMDYLSVSSS